MLLASILASSALQPPHVVVVGGGVGGLATAFAIVMLGLLRAIQRQPVQA